MQSLPVLCLGERNRHNACFTKGEASGAPAHVFHPAPLSIRRSAETRQLQRYSFLCGNLTMFNQLTLTCSRPEDSVPCRNAPVFYYVNDNIGYQDTPFLYDDDVSNADQFIHNNRLLEANPAAKRPF
ncbi:hypothetical protein MTO96_015997 [Rhipicephalus appendiculatus]